MNGRKLVDIAIRYTFTCGLEAIAYGNRRSVSTARERADRMAEESTVDGTLEAVGA